MMRRSTDIIHAMDPKALVVGLGGVCMTAKSRKTVEGILKTGEAKKVDILSYHLYWFNHGDASAYLYPELPKYAPETPLWNTEGALHQPTFYRTYSTAFDGDLATSSEEYRAVKVMDYRLRTAQTAQMWIDHLVQPLPVKRLFYYELAHQIPRRWNRSGCTRFSSMTCPFAQAAWPRPLRPIFWMGQNSIENSTSGIRS